MHQDVVHIGLPKAASTWIQDLVLPCVERDAYVPVRSALGRSLESLMYVDYVPGHLRRGADALRHTVGRRLVFSREGLSFLGKRIPGRPRVSLATTADRLVEELGDIVILFVIRRQDALVRAVYSQYVHRGGTLPLEQWIARRTETYLFDPDQYRHDWKIALWQMKAARVIVVPYEVLLVSSEEFLCRIGLALGKDPNQWNIDTGRRANASLSASGLEVLRHWNRWFRRTTENPSPPISVPYPALHRKLAQTFIEPVVRGWTTSRQESDSVIVSEFAEGFRDSNRLTQKFVDYDLSSLGYKL